MNREEIKKAVADTVVSFARSEAEAAKYSSGTLLLPHGIRSYIY